MDGYLYISYYDQTLAIPQSFEYVKPEDGEPEQLEILEHDLMPNELLIVFSGLDSRFHF